MYVFIVFIYLQAIFVIKDQFSLDFKDFNWSLCLLCLYKYCMAFIDASYSFEML